MNAKLNVILGIVCMLICSLFGVLGYYASSVMILIICVSIALLGYIGTKLKSGDVEILMSGCLLTMSVAIGYWIQTHVWVDTLMISIPVGLSFIIGTLLDIKETDPTFYDATRRIR